MLEDLENNNKNTDKNVESCYDEERTDTENEDGWYKKKRNFYVEKFGNSVLYIGRTFHVLKKYLKKLAFCSEKFSSGKIVAVVTKIDDERQKLYFKFFNHINCSNTSVSTEYGYVLCASLMSSDEKVRMVEFEAKNGTKKFIGSCLIGRRISKPFKKESNASNTIHTRFYSGFIQSYDLKSKLYHIHYPDDSDEEDLYEKELLQYLKP